MNLLHYYNPNPVFLRLGYIEIRWYGILMSLAILSGLVLILRLAKQKNISVDQVYDLASWSIISGILGARLYEVFIINWDYYVNNLSAIFKIWQGGLAIHGAIIGGALAVFVWSKKNKFNFWQLVDLIAVALPLGQAIGRWGNYFNQELFGLPTNWSIGIPIAKSNRPIGFENYLYFQPTFLYESLLNLLLFVFLILVYKKIKLPAGTVSILYLLGYSVIRFFMEFIRLDQTPVFWWLRLPQLVSIVIFVFGVSFLVRKKAINFLFG
ncbi:prolipoprotein diacylglyceryl transferase [Candidatus Falkowbacteria bacterium]|uniref:Phosphatidylglycerol--prolipoprotein diacylglyceryl transferase n=1 Tax=Candidatus Buchananbacteria bacterium CG10_big_fil_rev_8_21_14_0_10_33_19 TaxID=1974525 RepID=A0A2H0W4W9_9BACT|nr:prolipoprotein diacylglyceryl transferase [Candidatus Falkowbacteria bacterium]PIS06403.1 MAG: prolipoprotein diacylglyceryl transferase [Candidatus Buchananbacteria bacterium CG10_big_fil_rev_8_21_14_0_10_33_19]